MSNHLPLQPFKAQDTGTPRAKPAAPVLLTQLPSSTSDLSSNIGAEAAGVRGVCSLPSLTRSGLRGRRALLSEWTQAGRDGSKVWWRQKAPPHQSNSGLKRVSDSWRDCDYHSLILSQRETSTVSWGMPSRNSSRFAGIGALVNPFLLGCGL